MVLLIVAPEAHSKAAVKSMSQGSVASSPQVDFSEDDAPEYSQIVDNATRSRFVAPAWETESSNPGRYGDDYRVASSGERTQPARFKVEIPATDNYVVYARWPAAQDHSSATRFGISTTSGVEWTEVDQRKDGGIWVMLGVYEMKASNSYAIQVSGNSKGHGYVVADAVQVVRGGLITPNGSMVSDVSPDEGDTGDDTFMAAGSNPTRKDVVRRAKKFTGIRYKWGTCTKARMSCTCLTRKTWRPFGHTLPMKEGKQWQYKPSKRIKNRSNLRLGDVVFFKENGPNKPIAHVGIFSGKGNIVHASNYFGRVVESEMKYIKGYHGAKRLRIR